MIPKPAGVAQPRFADLVMGIVLYLGVSALFITLGTGSIRRRRWVRPMVLVIAWIWLITGIGAMIFWLIILPDMPRMMRASAVAAQPARASSAVAPPPSLALMTVMTGVMTAVMIALYVIVPAVLIALYRSPSVQATLEFFDPHAAWTDHCPLAVLGLAGVMAMGALWALFVIPQGMFFAFGMVLSPWPARACLILTASLFAIATVLIYRMNRAGWWVGVCLIALLSISGIVTLARNDLLSLYVRMGIPAEQIEQMRGMRAFNSRFFIGWIIAAAAIAIIYAVRVKRYLHRDSRDAYTMPP
jgi:hypothetical protein